MLSRATLAWLGLALASLIWQGVKLHRYPDDVLDAGMKATFAFFEEEDVAKVGGDFFGMVGDEDDGRGSFQLADVVEVLEETFSG